MLFGGKVNDPARPHQLAGFGNKHFTGNHFFGFTGFGILLHVKREALFKHQGNTFTHYPNGIYRIDKSFSWSVK